MAYVTSTGECPARAGADSTASAATAAIVTYYADRPIGTMLDVCVDQPTPKDWITIEEDADGDTGRCPGATRGTGPTTKRIRRTR